MNERTTPETDALECAFALLKCSPIGNLEKSSEYGRAAYLLSKHCQGKEDVSEAAMRIFAERINEVERERDELREKVEQQRKEIVRLNGATNHAGGTPLKIALRERDEAREELKHIAEYGTEEINAAVDLRQKLASALIERDEAKRLLENMKTAGIHSCHDQCQRPMCVLQRHNEELQQVIKTLRNCIRYDNQRIDELEEKINELRTKNN